jgi:hypothetical protein
LHEISDTLTEIDGAITTPVPPPPSASPLLSAPVVKFDFLRSQTDSVEVPKACLALAGDSPANPPTCEDLRDCNHELILFCATLPHGKIRHACEEE